MDESKVQVFPITPMGKPRMTRRDKWKSPARPAVARYRAFKDMVRVYGVTLDMNLFYHVVFALPVPSSWSKKRKRELMYGPHQAKPDKDNLEKALLDALFAEDAAAWDGRCSKIWSPGGGILISQDNIPLDRATLEKLTCKF
jgi:Holliday junction resolvase RusA-like endonuclease